MNVSRRLQTHSNFIARSSLWLDISTRPHHDRLATFFTSQDPFSSSALVSTLGIDVARDTKILVDPNTNRGKSVYLAIPFKVTERACNVFGKMHGGMSATLVDTITSLHMGEQNLPKLDMHVTTSLSIKFLASGNQDATLIALSQIDKMGKRLIFSRMRIIEDPTESELDQWLASNTPVCSENTKTKMFPDTHKIVEFVRQYPKVVKKGQHVKMFVEVPIGGKDGVRH